MVLAIVIGLSQSPVLSSGQTQADAVVQNLRQLPAPAKTRGPTEERRAAIHSKLRELGPAGVDALSRALADEDLMLRRNALIALIFLGRGYGPNGRTTRVDIRPAVPALLTTLRDRDSLVRAWSIQALEGTDPPPVAAVQPLEEMLKDTDIGVRLSACGALGDFRPGTAQTKAALQRTLKDSDPDVRRCAAFVLEKINK